MVSRLLNSRSKTITSAAFLLSASALISGLLGLFRNKLLAHFFGAGDIVDIYTTAFRLPDTVFTILIGGFLSAGFIPVFTAYLEKKSKTEAWTLANNVLNVLTILVIGACFMLFIFAPWLIKFMVPGFDKEKLALTLSLTRILFLSPIILGISNLISGALKSSQHFFVIALSPIFYNLGIIFGIIFFYQWWGLTGLALGVILGASLHLFIQLPTLLYSGWRWQGILDIKDQGLKKVLGLAPSRILALVISQINLFIITGFASTLGAGAVAIFFNFSKPLQDLPVAIFGLSFAAAAFPTLSLLAAKQNWSNFTKSFANTFRQIIFFIIPLSALMFVLRAQLVRVIYGSGAFNWSATIKTLDSLGYFVISLGAQALVLLLLPTFYSLKNTLTPLFSSLVMIVVSIISSFLLVPSLGVKGLALAFTLSYFAQALFLWIVLRERLPEFRTLDRPTLIFSLIISVASFFAGLVARQSLYFFALFLNTRTGLGILLQGLLAGIIGIVVYLLVCLLCHLPELYSLGKMLKGKYPKIYAEVSEEQTI